MRYFTGFLVSVGLIILILVIILKSGGSSNHPQPINLNSYANSDATVQLTIDGPINADQIHQSIQISIGRSESRSQLFQGYQGNIKTTNIYQNNQDAYTVFLHALNLVGFTKGNNDPKLSDERGYCPAGERYVFELTESGDIERYWATSCGSQGTYGGSVIKTLDLFKKQIPDYNSIANNFVL